MREFLAAMITGVLLAAAPLQLAAQTFPAKPVRLVVPFAPGGPIDLISRTVAGKLSEALGQPVVVDNRAGAGGSIAAEATAKSAPDGYTIMLITTGTQAINPALFAKVGYDPLKDFTYVTTIGTYSLVLLAAPNLEAKTLAEVIALARARPDTLNFGSGGNGSSSHLAGELFKTMAGLRMQHVPYKGTAAPMVDLMAGNLALMFDFISTGLPQIKAGKVRALAWTGQRRSPLIPDVPTMAEAGVPGFDVTAWVGIGAPAGLPREALDRLHADLVKSMGAPDLRDKLLAQGYELSTMTPEAFAALVKSDVLKWGKVVRDSNARVD
jgi:tripartite-type tricarboxylate transporter receptor subunit TctC